MNEAHPLASTLDAIEKQAPGFTPRVAVILGSGLGDFADQLQDPINIPYEQLPGFPLSRVPGHQGSLVLGKLAGVAVACLQGRAHPYEGLSPNAVKTQIRTMKLLGCEQLLITNAAGSLHKEVPPGELVLVSDHINFQPGNPLVGLNDDWAGPRFVDFGNAYDRELRANMNACAKSLNIKVTEGVYLSTLGPNFETPAEIRAFRVMGADLVGMSTVPEVFVARHCDLKVLAISVVTNYAAGMEDETLSHEHTLSQANKTSKRLCQLLEHYITQLP